MGFWHCFIRRHVPVSWLKAISPMIADPNQPQELRKAAISVLGDYNDSWAVPTLQQLLSDGDAEIRQAAQE